MFVAGTHDSDGPRQLRKSIREPSGNTISRIFKFQNSEEHQAGPVRVDRSGIVGIVFKCFGTWQGFSTRSAFVFHLLK